MGQENIPETQHVPKSRIVAMEERRPNHQPREPAVESYENQQPEIDFDNIDYPPNPYDDMSEEEFRALYRNVVLQQS